MPPKIKVTKEEIVSAALAITRKEGAEALNARTVAARLGCSTQPVFSNFATMDELRLAVVEKGAEICRDYILQEVQKEEYPPYKASGMAYIRFAEEEKALFRLLYMRDRSSEPLPEKDPLGEKMEEMIQKGTGLSKQRAKLFHLETWAFVHGIAIMQATGFAKLPTSLISQMLTDLYQGLKKQYGV